MKPEQDKQIDEIISRLESLKQTDKPKFEVGKVYKQKLHIGSLGSTLFIYSGEKNNYGFDVCGNWSTEIGCTPSFERYPVTPATTEEWKQALENEARKKGYTTNNFKCLTGPQVYTDTFEFHYSEDKDYLYIGSECNGNRCYSQGQWAEVVEEKIMVGKWEVKDFNKGAVSINGVGFTRFHFTEFENIIKYTGVSILIEGEELTLDVCQKIINRLSK